MIYKHIYMYKTISYTILSHMYTMMYIGVKYTV